MDQSEDGNLVCNQILLAITQLELAFTTIALAHSLGRFGAIRRFNLPAVQDLLKIAGMEKGLEAVFSLTQIYRIVGLLHPSSIASTEGIVLPM